MTKTVSYGTELCYCITWKSILSCCYCKKHLWCFYIAIGNGLDVVIDDENSIDSGLNDQIVNVVFGGFVAFLLNDKTDNETR